MPDADLPRGEIRSYILRLWEEDEAVGCVWRVSLTRIPDGERLGFADLEAAFEYLRAQICRRASGQGGAAGGQSEDK